MTKKFSELVDFLAVGRDTYKAKYNVLKEQKEKELKDLHANFKPNAPLYKKTRDDIEQRFNEAVSELRETVSSQILPHIEDLQAWEMAKAQKIDENAIRQMAAISDLPLSRLEVNVLADKYGRKDYYVDKILRNIAEKNGIPSHQIESMQLSAPIDLKMDILGQMRNQFSDLLSGYDGTVRYQTEVLLAESILFRAEKMYENGYIEPDISDEQTARRAFSAIKNAGNDMDRMIALKNVLANANERVRLELLVKLSCDSTVSDSAFSFAGCLEEIREFRAGKASKYSQARELMKKLDDCGNDTQKMGEIIMDNKENPFFRRFVEEGCLRSRALNEAAEAVNEATGTVIVNTVVELAPFEGSGDNGTEAQGETAAE